MEDNKKEIEFDYDLFNYLINDHKKDMKKQVKKNLGTPKKVFVYENNKKLGFRYEY